MGEGLISSCALVGIRTPNLLIRSEMLYPIELQMHFVLRTAKISHKIDFLQFILKKYANDMNT